VSDNVVIVGATSGIARALADVLARRQCRLLLAGRDEQELEALAADLRVRHGTNVATERFEALDFGDHPDFWQRCQKHFDGSVTGVVVCHGYLPDQAEAERDFREIERTFAINFLSAVSVLNLAAETLGARRQGFLAAISSVAGDRGRASNYVYGASKAALSAYLDGLRNRLHASGVQVLSIKPGFVDTAMTRGKLKPSRLLATPERVARDIDRALRRRQDVLYTPWFWRPIMAVIRGLPERIFKRLSL
jgi:short-subunit dehydrogenase